MWITLTAKLDRPLAWKTKGRSQAILTKLEANKYDIKTAADRNGCTGFGLGYSGKEGRMTYRDRLSPWCIIRHLPQSQRLVVACSRRRNDAEEHLRVLRQMTPNEDYSIIFDPMLETSQATTNS